MINRAKGRIYIFSPPVVNKDMFVFNDTCFILYLYVIYNYLILMWCLWGQTSAPQVVFPPWLFVSLIPTPLAGSSGYSFGLSWHWPLKENGAEERNMATSNNPRKFSEKIALHNQKQAEETAAFEEVMKDLSITRAARVTKPVLLLFLFLFSVLFSASCQICVSSAAAARSRGRIGKQ